MSPREAAYKKVLVARAEEDLAAALQVANEGDLVRTEDALAVATRSLGRLEFLHGPISTAWAQATIDRITSVIRRLDA